jgi:hypothetical protein
MGIGLKSGPLGWVPKRVSAIAASLVVIAGLMAFPASTAAFSSSVSATIVKSACDRGWAWHGGIDYYSYVDQQDRGTFDYCITVLKLADSDSSADYYALDQTVDWNVSVYQTWANQSKDNYAKLTVSSSIAASGSVYAATPTITSSSGNCTYISVGVAFGPFSVGVTPDLCDYTRLSRDSMGSSSVQWSSSNIAATPHWEVSYMQKVPQGARPYFTARLYYPNYAVSQGPVVSCSGGYATCPTVNVTRQWSYDPWTSF